MTSRRFPIAPVPPADRSGPLEGMRVVEIASQWSAYTGKMLGDLGAEVILVEPVGGALMRGWAPFRRDEPGLENSLWWWYYQTGKRSVVLSFHDTRLATLCAHADIVIESGELDLKWHCGANPRLIVTSITPFGRSNPRAHERATDLTILAGGGPVWMCGYDDHTLPPVRGGGNQAMHTAGLHAVSATLMAVFHQLGTGRGQHVDVSAHAAANVTTEAGSYEWLVAQRTVQRQTGRHAAVTPTGATSALDRNGRAVNTGFPPRSTQEFTAVLQWIDELGLRNDFPDVVLLELGIERGGVRLRELATDELALEIFGGGRAALALIASRLDDIDFFEQGQGHGLAVGVIAAPEDVMENRHYVERGFVVEVDHPELGRSFRYPGAPIAFGASPWKIRCRAPFLGEHNDQVLD